MPAKGFYAATIVGLLSALATGVCALPPGSSTEPSRHATHYADSKNLTIEPV